MYHCLFQVSDEAFTDFIVYAAAIYSNKGNYKSFGDIKFIPAVSAEDFHAIITVRVSTDISIMDFA